MGKNISFKAMRDRLHRDLNRVLGFEEYLKEDRKNREEYVLAEMLISIKEVCIKEHYII